MTSVHTIEGMLTFLVVTVIILTVYVGVVIKHNMALISSLTPRLQELQVKINSISLDVQRLKDAAVQAGEIPAEAEALLFNLSSTVDALAANSAPVPAQPSPSPLP